MIDGGKMQSIFFIICFVVLSVIAVPAIENNDNTIQSYNRHQFEETFLKKLNTKCTLRDNNACIMLKWMAYMNRMLKKSSIDIGQNIEVTQTRNVEVTMDTDEDLVFSRAARSDDETLSFIIADKLLNFIQTRTLRYKMSREADIVLSTEPQGNLNLGLSINARNAFESGRGRLRHMAPLIAAIATKVGIIGALVFKGLVMLVGKALIVSKVALLLAVVIGLKKLLNKKHVTYEVVAHPHHTESHHHDTYSAGWGRALDGFFEALDALPDDVPDAQEQVYANKVKSFN